MCRSFSDVIITILKVITYITEKYFYGIGNILKELIDNEKNQRQIKLYIPVSVKFWLTHLFAILWTSLSIYISLPWLEDFSKVVAFPAALIIISGIAYLPGYLNAFLLAGLILDRQPPFRDEYPEKDITVLIAARNEGKRIADTIYYIAKQDYTGNIKILIIDNGSEDDTVVNALKAGEAYNLDLSVISEEIPGKFNALNTGLEHVSTDLCNYIGCRHPSA